MIGLTVQSLEPLHLSKNHTVSQIARTLDYIPGSTFRGALAAEYLTQNGSKEDERFRRWFMGETTRFNPLYPSFESRAISWVLPSSAFRCKSHPGFLKPPECHGIKDMLLELLGPTPQDRCNYQHHPTQPVCSSALIVKNGFYAGKPGNEELVEPSKRFITQTALDNRRESASAGQLFTLEVIEENQFFTGSIILNSLDEEKEFLDWLRNTDCLLHIGSARTRGHGQIKLLLPDNVEEKNCVPDEKSLLEKLKNFDKEVKAVLPTDKEGFYFCITLLSDTILYDDFLQGCEKLDSSGLGRYIHTDLELAQPISTFCRNHLVDGWNAVQRLPKQAELAIAAGGVFLFFIQADINQLVECLKWVEIDGLGERRAEGFGNVVINHPFHLERRMQ